MTKEIQDPEDQADRVDNVLKRAGALSDELRRTISELTQILRSDNEGAANVRHPTN